MVYSCCVDGCRSNFPGTNETVTVFDFPNEDCTCEVWQEFAAGSREGWEKKATSRICMKHFAPRYIKEGVGENGRSRLIKGLIPVQTIFLPGDSPAVSHMKAPKTEIPRKPPKKRVYREDEYEKFLEMDVIKSFENVRRV